MDRVTAARERVRQVSAELRSPAVELPCIKCRYYELACTHPAVAEVASNPETGTVKLKAASAKDARSEAGACGPEGALFDSRSLPGAVIVSMMVSPVGRIVLIVGALLGCAALFG